MKTKNIESRTERTYLKRAPHTLSNITKFNRLSIFNSVTTIVGQVLTYWDTQENLFIWITGLLRWNSYIDFVLANMDAGTYSQGDPMDRRSTKRRKPGSASSLEQDHSSKPAKQTKDDFELNCGSKPLTCDDLGYSNLPGGNGNFQSNSHTDQRQVHSFSNGDSTPLIANAFDCPNERSENDCKFDTEIYSHLDLGIECNAKFDNAKSTDQEIRETFDSRSGSGDSVTDTDSCLITGVKSPVSKTLHSEYIENNTPRPKPPSLTELTNQNNV